MKYSKICKEFKNFKERLSSELDSKNAFFTLFSGIENKQECPDYILIDFSSGNRIGIELSSVYIDNRSIPDKHIKSDNCYIADDENKINQFSLSKLSTALIDDCSFPCIATKINIFTVHVLE